ncbi:hypothetical protein Dimus_007917 [Dionaea muscipula]
MTVSHLKKKDVIKSSVKGIGIEFDHERLATILGVPGRNGICEYIKEVWEESKYTKPLEITRRFANDEALTAARRVKSGEMKPFQRFIHFLVMKNVIPRFGKRDTSSFMDLTYMDHLMARRLVDPPRVMMRHMSYVISMKDHELPYGDWLTLVFEAFGVPLVIKKEKNLRNMISLKTSSSPCASRLERMEFGCKRGEYGSGEKFYDAEDENQGSPEGHEEIPAGAPSSAHDEDKEPSETTPRVLLARKSNLRNFKQSLKERGQTDFMMIWRRPKLRMPNF